MARQLSFQYPGAVYHMMARGGGGKQLFPGRDDHGSFLHWLEQVCGSHGWCAGGCPRLTRHAAFEQWLAEELRTVEA